MLLVRALPPETSAFPLGIAKGPPLFVSASPLPGQLTVAIHPNLACHNNPAREKTQNPKFRQPSPKKEMEQPQCLSWPHPPSLLHNPTQTHGAHLSALNLSRQPLPRTPSPLPHIRTHMAHCSFSFLMELYKA